MRLVVRGSGNEAVLPNNFHSLRAYAYDNHKYSSCWFPIAQTRIRTLALCGTADHILPRRKDKEHFSLSGN